MKAQIELTLNEDHLNKYVEKMAKDKIKELIEIEVKKAIIKEVNDYFIENVNHNDLNAYFEVKIMDQVAAYAARKANMFFQDLEDSLFGKKKTIERITMHYDVSKEEKAFYEGLFMAFLAYSKDLPITEKAIVDSVSEKVFEDIRNGQGYKLLAYRLTQAYKKEQKRIGKE